MKTSILPLILTALPVCSAGPPRQAFNGSKRSHRVIIDRFGSNINLIPRTTSIVLHVDAVISNQFLGWIIGLGPGIKIIAPADAVQRLKEIGQRLLEQY